MLLNIGTSECLVTGWAFERSLSVWICKCVSRSPDCLNVLSQDVHPHGFSPTWIRRCFFRLSDTVNVCPHIEHTYGLSPVWICMCSLGCQIWWIVSHIVDNSVIGSSLPFWIFHKLLKTMKIDCIFWGNNCHSFFFSALGIFPQKGSKICNMKMMKQEKGEKESKNKECKEGKDEKQEKE